MKKIVLRPFQHRSKESFGIFFDDDKDLNLLIRKLPGIKWSQTHKCWYLPCNQQSYRWICECVAGKAKIDSSALNTYLQKKKEVIATAVYKKEINPVSVNNSPAWKLCAENLASLRLFVDQLKLKAYSTSTIATYRSEFLQLLKLLKSVPVNKLTADDLRRYMVYAMEKEGISENTAHSRLNALKFYFEQVLKREKFFWEIPRPKRALKLPNVLGEKEIGRLFSCVTNPKHKAILFTAYSAGMRVSEVVALKLADIDSDRMQIKIVDSKGKKDRYVALSPVLLDVLRSYLKTSNSKPLKYLFEAEKRGTAYSSRSAQKVFQRAKLKAGIRKEVSFHSLRHSFATHLLEKGTDIRYIKDILGHFDIKTTERYTHVARETLVHIASPLDDLWRKGHIK